MAHFEALRTAQNRTEWLSLACRALVLLGPQHTGGSQQPHTPAQCASWGGRGERGRPLMASDRYGTSWRRSSTGTCRRAATVQYRAFSWGSALHWLALELIQWPHVVVCDTGVGLAGHLENVKRKDKRAWGLGHRPVRLLSVPPVKLLCGLVISAFSLEFSSGVQLYVHLHWISFGFNTAECDIGVGLHAI